MVYLRSMRYSSHGVNKGAHRKAEKKTGEMISLSSAMFILVLDR
jgi:hypothetical protein